MSRRAFTHFVMSTMAALQSEEGAESDHLNVEQESAPPHPAESGVGAPILSPSRTSATRRKRGSERDTAVCGITKRGRR